MQRQRLHSVHSVPSAVSLLAAMAVVALTAGCENSVEPFAETTRHFAIYGSLDADVDTQYVRVEATRPFLDAGAIDESINASAEASSFADVTTRNLVTGDVVSWRDSTIEFDDGGRGLLYWAVFRPIHGHAYRIEVVREDGATSSATTTVPDLVSVDPRTPHQTFAATFEQSLIFADVARRPESITLNYDVAFESNVDPVRITLDYSFLGVPSPDGWKIDVRLTRDRERINGRLSLQPTAVLYLQEVSMTVRLLSTDWPFVGSAEEVNNIVDGFGFFGAAATHTAHWRIDSLTVRRLGFEDEQRRPSSGG